MSDVFVEPAQPVKEKKKRAPMSEERKAVLREQLAKAREVKKAARLAAKAEKEALKNGVPKACKTEPKTEEPKTVEPSVLPPAVAAPPPPPATSDYKSEIAELRAELAAFKKSQPWEYSVDEVNALKQELKDIRDAAKAYKDAKTKATKEAKAQKAKEAKDAKALQKKLDENHVASPAPHKPPPSLPIPVPQAPRYSTYRKSIWSQFK